MFSGVARYLALVALAVWIGSLVFFGAVLAPAAFSQLGPHVAGPFIGTTLRHLHLIGLACGGFAVLCLLLAGWGRLGKTAAAIVLVLAMMALTEVSQLAIIPAMDQHRAEVQDISATPPGDPDRAAFDQLHDWSEWLEEGVLICGLAALALASAAPRSYYADDGSPAPRLL